MIAQRFRSIGWVAGCAVAALGCYLASQTVASERAALARVDRQIAVAEDDIRRLNTEIAARGRMGQIERWNREVLALQAPAPGQFVANEIQLASLASGRPLPLDPAIVASKGAVTAVAYEAPARSAPVQTVAAVDAPAPAQPLLRQATYVQPKPSPLGLATPVPVVKASLTVKAVSTAIVPAEKPANAYRPTTPAKITASVTKRGKPVSDKPAKVERVVHEDDAPTPAPRLIKVAALAMTAVPVKASHSLLPSDLGTLIAAEKKGGKAAAKPVVTKASSRATDR